MSCFRHCCLLFLLLTKEIAWWLFFRSYCFLSKSTAHRKKNIGAPKLKLLLKILPEENWYDLKKLLYCRLFPQSFLLIPSVIILPNFLLSLLLDFFEVIFVFSFFTLQRMLSLCEKNWGPKFIAVYYPLV